jgi:hypothetical protein
VTSTPAAAQQVRDLAPPRRVRDRIDPEYAVTAMDLTIQSTSLPHNDPDASLALYRDTLGFEARNDVAYGGMRWITAGPADQPGTSIFGLPVRL